MFCWGIIACLHATVSGYTELMILRFLLGVFESGFFPVKIKIRLELYLCILVLKINNSELTIIHVYNNIGCSFLSYIILQEK